MPLRCKELEDSDPALTSDCERPRLHSHVVAERDDVDGIANHAEEVPEVLHVYFYQGIQERFGPGRLAREKHEEIVVAVEEQARFEDASTEQVDDGSLAGLA